MKTPPGGERRRVLPNYLLASAVAPVAGALAAGALAMIIAAPWRLGLGPWRSQVHGESLGDRVGATVGVGLLAGVVAFFVAVALVAIIACLSVIQARRKGETISRRSVLGCGLFTGVLPFAAFALVLGVPSELTSNGGPGRAWAVVFFLLTSAAASFATAWTFWRCGLQGRRRGDT